MSALRRAGARCQGKAGVPSRTQNPIKERMREMRGLDGALAPPGRLLGRALGGRPGAALGCGDGQAQPLPRAAAKHGAAARPSEAPGGPARPVLGAGSRRPPGSGGSATGRAPGHVSGRRRLRSLTSVRSAQAD